MKAEELADIKECRKVSTLVERHYKRMDFYTDLQLAMKSECFKVAGSVCFETRSSAFLTIETKSLFIR